MDTVRITDTRTICAECRRGITGLAKTDGDQMYHLSCGERVERDRRDEETGEGE